MRFEAAAAAAAATDDEDDGGGGDSDVSEIWSDYGEEVRLFSNFLHASVLSCSTLIDLLK